MGLPSTLLALTHAKNVAAENQRPALLVIQGRACRFSKRAPVYRPARTADISTLTQSGASCVTAHA